MPTKLRPANPPDELRHPLPARLRAAHRPVVRALALAGLALGVLVPATAVRAAPSPAEIQARITRESTALTKIVEEYNKVNEELKVTKAATARHAAKLPEMQSKLATAESDVREIASTAYKSGHLREVDAMLTGDGAGGMLDRIGTLDHLARGRRAQIAGFAEARTRYDLEKRRLDATLAKQKIQARDLAARKVKIEADLKKLFDLRRQAYGQAQETGSRYTGKIPAVSGQAGVAVRYAYNAIGKPYSWGDDGPGGYDCSGLTLAAWRAAGRSLPHNAAMQWDRVAHISRSELAPGDLVFYSGLGHVGLYVGSNKIVHAPTFGRTVELAGVNMMTPYGYGRVR